MYFIPFNDGTMWLICFKINFPFLRLEVLSLDVVSNRLYVSLFDQLVYKYGLGYYSLTHTLL